MAKYRSARRAQDSAGAEDQYRHRELGHYYDNDGCLVIKARLPAEQGALVIKALEMAMEARLREARSDEATSARDSTANAVPSGQERENAPIAARRADALAEVAETYMNNSESSGSTADRFQVVVHVAANTSEIEDGPHVTAETSRRIACDSSIVGIRENADGEPLSIGRRSRSIPPPMRRALGIRDGGCRFPGCTNTRFVDGHHIKHWADGGETSLDNLVLLCRHHHRFVHEGGFDCEKSADDEIYFVNRQREPMPNNVLQPGITGGLDLESWLDREFFEATEGGEGCVAKWYAGDRMDWNMAVSALF